MKMRPFGHLIPVAEAQRRTLQAVRPIRRTESVPLARALGRVAARTYRSPVPIPPFRRATWDGYAVRSRDTRGASSERPVHLRVVGEVYAEGGYERPVGSGEAVAIATGGAIPRGADTVVIFEHVELADTKIRVSNFIRPRQRIANPGADFPRGSLIVAKGSLLTPVELGALASIGRGNVTVYARPRVAILPNGNELVVPGRRLSTGQIHESNNFTLSALVEAAGGEPHPHPPLPDDPDVIEKGVRRALRANDLVLITGGSSVGERDYLAAVFPRVGRLLFHGIAVRPGKPTLVASTGGKLLIGMPGHPTSCLANGFWLLLPVLRKLGHRAGPGWSDVSVRLTEDYLPPSPDLATVIPLRLRGERGFPTFRDSSAITSLQHANAFAIVPARHRLSAGTRLRAHRLPAPIVEDA
ncbi:MAG: molybdopterin molybdotransferase MoeA [Thermoplasmata archaeon]